MCNKDNCCIYDILNIVISLIAGVGVASVFFTGTVASITVLLYITLILGILGLIGAFVSSIINHHKHCVIYSNLINSSIGAIITSSFALAVSSLILTSLPFSILIGTVAFFLTFLLINIIIAILHNICHKKCCN